MFSKDNSLDMISLSTSRRRSSSGLAGIPVGQMKKELISQGIEVERDTDIAKLYKEIFRDKNNPSSTITSTSQTPWINQQVGTSTPPPLQSQQQKEQIQRQSLQQAYYNSPFLSSSKQPQSLFLNPQLPQNVLSSKRAQIGLLQNSQDNNKSTDPSPYQTAIQTSGRYSSRNINDNNNNFQLSPKESLKVLFPAKTNEENIKDISYKTPMNDSRSSYFEPKNAEKSSNFRNSSEGRRNQSQMSQRQSDLHSNGSYHNSNNFQRLSHETKRGGLRSHSSEQSQSDLLFRYPQYQSGNRDFSGTRASLAALNNYGQEDIMIGQQNNRKSGGNGNFIQQDSRYLSNFLGYSDLKGELQHNSNFKENTPIRSGSPRFSQSLMETARAYSISQVKQRNGLSNSVHKAGNENTPKQQYLWSNKDKQTNNSINNPFQQSNKPKTYLQLLARFWKYLLRLDSNDWLILILGSIFILLIVQNIFANLHFTSIIRNETDSSQTQAPQKLIYCDSVIGGRDEEEQYFYQVQRNSQRQTSCRDCPINAVCLNNFVKCMDPMVLIDEKCVTNPVVQRKAVEYIQYLVSELSKRQAYYFCYSQESSGAGSDFSMPYLHYSYDQLAQILTQHYKMNETDNPEENDVFLHFQVLDQVKENLFSKSIRKQFDLQYNVNLSSYFVTTFQPSLYCRQAIIKRQCSQRWEQNKNCTCDKHCFERFNDFFFSLYLFRARLQVIRHMGYILYGIIAIVGVFLILQLKPVQQFTYFLQLYSKNQVPTLKAKQIQNQSQSQQEMYQQQMKSKQQSQSLNQKQLLASHSQLNQNRNSIDRNRLSFNNSVNPREQQQIRQQSSLSSTDSEQLNNFSFLNPQSSSFSPPKRVFSEYSSKRQSKESEYGQGQVFQVSQPQSQDQYLQHSEQITQRI